MTISFDQVRMHWIIGQERWPIQRFHAREGLNQPMTARIELSARLGREPAELLGQPSRLEIIGTDGHKRHFDGVVTAAEWGDTTGSDHHWTLTLASKLLTGRLQERARLMMTASRRDAVQTLLQEMGYQTTEVQWQLSGGARHLPLPRLQARETNYDCFARLLSEAGWNYWFEPGDDQDLSERLVISEQQRFPALDLLPLRAASVYGEAEPGHVNRLSSFDYGHFSGTAPSLRTRIRSGNAFAPVGLKPAAPLERYKTGYWETFAAPQDQVASERLVQQDAARQPLTETRVSIGSHQPILQPGHRIAIDCSRGAHPQLTGDYLMLTVEHHGEQPHQGGDGGQNGIVQYRNQAELLSIRDRRILPAIIEPPKYLPMLFPARIESRSPLYADLDQDGRYYLRTRFDATRPEEDAPHTQASPAIEVRVPYASPLGERKNPVGWHFPLLDQSTVLVSCLNGDPNRPLIMGFSPNRKVLNPVTRKNATQYRLISPAQNELSFDDAPANPCILMQTFDGEVRLALNSKEAEPFIELATRYGALNINVAKDLIQKAIDGSLNERIAQHRRLQVQNNSHTQVGGTAHYQARGDQNWVAKDSFKQVSQGRFLISHGGPLRLKTQGALTVKAANGYSIQVPDGSTWIETPDEIRIESQQNILLASEGGESGIEITPSKITLFGPHITLKGDTAVNFNGDVHYEDGSHQGTTVTPLSPLEIPEITPVERLPDQVEEEITDKDRCIRLLDEQGQPLAQVPYRALYDKPQHEETGITTDTGHTHVLLADARAKQVTVHIEQEEPPHA
ncbi:MAG: hypothetical protein LAT65_12440 [Saccharospirillum sp.]|nr:hypothetical protein [Saccharospirillum sp.]